MNAAESPIVRKATEADLPSLVAIDSYAVAHPERASAIARAIDQGECLVCVADGKAAGYIVVDHSFFGRGFIPLVVVAPSMRRQGIAQLLFAAAESQCKTGALFTSTNASNTEAQRLLERIGFKASGRIENLDAGDSELVYFKNRASPAR